MIPKDTPPETRIWAVAYDWDEEKYDLEERVFIRFEKNYPDWVYTKFVGYTEHSLGLDECQDDVFLTKKEVAIRCLEHRENVLQKHQERVFEMSRLIEEE